MEHIYIGLGSNLAEPLQQVESAIASLQALPNTRLIKVSPWYRSKAIGPGQQPDYINGVAALDSSLRAYDLLAALQEIEANHGRERRERWAARTLDLDILLYGEQIIATDHLQVPHPRLHQRNFVLYPLADLAPELVFPDGRSLASLMAHCPDDGLIRLKSA